MRCTAASTRKSRHRADEREEGQLKKIVDVVRGWHGVAVLVLALLPVFGNAAQDVTASKSSDSASQQMTGHESMWGVVGVLDVPVLALVNASPLLLSELNDYQDAVDHHRAMPFAKLTEDWSGAKMRVLTNGVKQIEISPDALVAPPTAFVGDLSHGLGYFANYTRDQSRYDIAMKSANDAANLRRVAGISGVWMESEAEVNNYLVQQQIIDATRSAPHGPVIVKLANDANANGTLQRAFDKLSASDSARGFTATEHQAHLEQIAYELTGMIAVPRGSALSGRAPQPQTEAQGTFVLPSTEGGLRERSALISGFVARVARIADSGTLDDPGKTMSLLGMDYRADTVQKAPSPPDCAINWHPRSQLVTTVERAGSDWYVPTQYGVQNLHVPGFFVNPPETIKGDPGIHYAITHTITCGDGLGQQLVDHTEVELDLYTLPSYACITSADIAQAIPRTYAEGATDGVTFYGYRGHTDDDTGTVLSFVFRAGAPCALFATIKQSQQSSLRYARAVSKFHACYEETSRAFCASRPSFGFGDAAYGEMKQAILQRCETINAVYLAEPKTGLPPPPPEPFRNQTGPCP